MTDIKDAIEEILPIDIACQKQKQSTESCILVLTNPISPIHFLFLPQCYWGPEARKHTMEYVVISCFLQ